MNYIRVTVVMIVLGVVGWVFYKLSEGAKAKRQLETTEAALVGAGKMIKSLQDSYAVSERLQSDYEKELHTLRDSARTPAPVVRLCHSPTTANLPAPAISAPVTTGTPAGPGDIHGTPAGDPVEGPNIGPELVALTQDADNLLALTRFMQAKLRTLDTSCAVP